MGLLRPSRGLAQEHGVSIKPLATRSTGSDTYSVDGGMYMTGTPESRTFLGTNALTGCYSDSG